MSNGLKEAEYYEVISEEDKIVKCTLCPLNCELLRNQKGVCKARMNIGGKLYSLTYGFTKMRIELIEKQSLFHFYPGSRVQTFSTYNCNLDCIYCPVADISQINSEDITGKRYSPDQALMFAIASGAKVVCFGDSEPLVSFEWVRDTAKLAKERDMQVVLRTNAYFSEEVVQEILQYVDGIMIEFKAINDEGYKKIASRGSAEHVKKVTKLIYESGKHLEIGIELHKDIGNDLVTAGALANWIKTELSQEVPLHLIRLLPAYKTMNLQPTPQEMLEEAYKLAKEAGLKYVYLDRVPGHKYANTYCPNCGEELITRTPTSTEVRRISLQGLCNKCQTKINIVMSKG